ncbi:MAG: glutamate synthase [Deltaproteobacteria bacterium]|nr:glutamate synthase [Deltaproteobacteria bacterium]
MSELIPLPFDRLLSRMFREKEREQCVFGLPVDKFAPAPSSGRSWSVRFHGHDAATPLGPAAGPHTQLAQNIVLSFLGGGRIMELKTVQVMDRLTIPRPCIDMRTAGYNVEWSQELTLEQSLEEYVKASMLVDILRAAGWPELPAASCANVFDMSVGYDLAGIQGDRVQAFIRGMQDATAVVDRLRAQLPAEFRRYRDLPFRTRLSDTLTLSTFHGCPPDEIERIAAFLMEHNGLHVIVKLNPTLLGPGDARRILNDQLGWPDHIPDEAFAEDASWDQASAFVGRLGEQARALGRSFGVKFSNTLIVENRDTFFPSEKVMYMSGPPLHVLAMTLVGRFRAAFGDRFPVSFSGGINKSNFADAVSLGIVPVTVCSDLLRTNGYERLAGYFKDLDARMAAAGARDLDEFVVRGRGKAEAALARAGADEPHTRACRDALATGGNLRAAAGEALYAKWVAEARLLNTADYVDGLARNPRYARAQNAKPPRKVGSHLTLFDCLTCDKCLPVCPNNANFTYALPAAEIPVLKARHDGHAWKAERQGALKTEQKHQIANYADFCNECGNCDVFCPEDGGPYVVKPRFFGSHEEFRRHARLDGMHVARRGGALHVHGRFNAVEYVLVSDGGRSQFSGKGFDVRFREDAPESTLEGQGSVEVDLTWAAVMRWLGNAVMDARAANYVNT